MRSPASPENQGVSFAELFFDLAFVFAVTKTVELFAGHFTWGTVAQGTIIFWLIWWAWTQLTWTLNAADTTHTVVVTAILVCTGIAFFMAVEVPEAFAGRALWFAVPYLWIRVIGLCLYAWVAATDKAKHRAVRTFAIASVGGLVAVVVGAIAGGQLQMWLWALAILLDILALMIAARSKSWDIHPSHFCERHGLFVIIALGETLVVAATDLRTLDKTGTLLTVGILTIATSCGMWWLYFARMKPHMERAMATAEGAKLSALARDAYSLFHFLILGGIVAFAVAIEQAFHHSSDPLSFEIQLAAAFSAALFGVGTALAFWRATGRLLVARLLLSLATFGIIVFIKDIEPFVALVVALAAMVAVAAIEHKTLAPVEG